MILVYLRTILKRLAALFTRSTFPMLALAIISLILLGTTVYSLSEGWSWLDALYATIITITTVGYGDLSPQTTSGRIFAVVFTLGAIGIGGYALTEMTAVVIERQATRKERRLGNRRMKAIKELHDHIIVCGVDHVGMHVAKEYQRTNTPFVIVESDEAVLKTRPAFHARRILPAQDYRQLVGFRGA